MGEAARKLESVPMPEFSSNRFLSIQGEQQEAEQLDLFMDQADVDAYVDSVDNAILTCRERARHAFPTTRETGLRFSGVDGDTGLLIRRVMCPCCNLAERVELWDVQHRGSKVTRCEFVSAQTVYHTERRKDGTIRRYTAPAGRGRMKPKQVKNAIATGLLGGQNFTQILKEAKAAQRERD